MTSPKPARGEPVLGNVLSRSSDPDGDAPSESPSGELPAGLVEAVSEMRAAEDDETAARALLEAVQICKDA